MKIKDFALLFNEKDFPIKWQKEYLRLLTTFEVNNNNNPLKDAFGPDILSFIKRLSSLRRFKMYCENMKFYIWDH